LYADPDYSKVNARVSEVSDWIDAMVCDLSENPPVEFSRVAGAIRITFRKSHGYYYTHQVFVRLARRQVQWQCDRRFTTEWSRSSRTMVILILLLPAAALAMCLISDPRFLVIKQN
jgi:hypothetical protein